MRRNIIVIQIILFLSLLSCDVISVEKYYDLAFDLEEKGKYLEAIAYHNKALTKNPEFIPSLLNRGADKSMINDFNGAIDDYKKILEIDPQLTFALVNLGNNYDKLKKYEKAIKSYTKAIETRDVLKGVKDKEGNIIYLELKFNSESSTTIYDYEIYYSRGLSYFNNENFQLAISDFKKSLETEYKKGEVYYWIGKSYIGIKDINSACENFIASSKLGVKDSKELLEKYCKKDTE